MAGVEQDRIIGAASATADVSSHAERGDAGHRHRFDIHSDTLFSRLIPECSEGLDKDAGLQPSRLEARNRHDLAHSGSRT